MVYDIKAHKCQKTYSSYNVINRAARTSKVGKKCKTSLAKRVPVSDELREIDIFPSMEISCSNHLTEAVTPKLFCEKGVLKNFAKFTGKHMWRSIF